MWRHGQQVPTGGLEYCAEKYAKRQIKIVSPKVAICLGMGTYNALRTTEGLETVGKRWHESTHAFTYNGADIIGVTHTEEVR